MVARIGFARRPILDGVPKRVFVFNFHRPHHKVTARVRPQRFSLVSVLASSEEEVSSLQFCTHLSSSWIQNSDKMEKYFMLLALAVTGKTIIVVELVEALYTAK